MKPYDGSKDSVEHLYIFQSWMELEMLSNVKSFCLLLARLEHKWFRKLKRRLIASFWELARAFINNSLEVEIKGNLPPIYLLTIKQGREETLREYVARFNSEVLQIESYTDDATLTAIVTNLRD